MPAEVKHIIFIMVIMLYGSTIMAADCKTRSFSRPEWSRDTIVSVEEYPVQEINPEFVFLGSSPNPFENTVSIKFTSKSVNIPEISILDINGRIIRVFPIVPSTDGTYTIEWDGADDNGMNVSPGIYIIRFIHSGNQYFNKLMLIR